MRRTSASHPCGRRFPPPRDDAELAAAAIGQGGVEAGPVHMATVAAATATGSWRPPVLLVGGRPSGAAPRPLDAGAWRALQDLMEGVVSQGTGVGAQVPGVDLQGKTGTAEFGLGTPPPTHAWFIGHFATVGFAVLVEGGGVGSRVAAPIVGRFFATRAGRGNSPGDRVRRVSEIRVEGMFVALSGYAFTA